MGSIRGCAGAGNSVDVVDWSYVLEIWGCFLANYARILECGYE